MVLKKLCNKLFPLFDMEDKHSFHRLSFFLKEKDTLLKKYNKERTYGWVLSVPCGSDSFTEALKSNN